jgi:hypothetical protein
MVIKPELRCLLIFSPFDEIIKPLLGDVARWQISWRQEGRGATMAFEGWGENGGSVGEEDWAARALCLFPKM